MDPSCRKDGSRCIVASKTPPVGHWLVSSHLGCIGRGEWTGQYEGVELQCGQASVHSIGQSDLVTGRGQHAKLLGSLGRGACRAICRGRVLVHRWSSNVPVGTGQISHVVDVGVGTAVCRRVVQCHGSNRREIVSNEGDQGVVKGGGLQRVRRVLRRRVPDVDRGVAWKHKGYNDR